MEKLVVLKTNLEMLEKKKENLEETIHLLKAKIERIELHVKRQASSAAKRTKKKTPEGENPKEVKD